ncbi:hypothetical protein ACJMK2_000777 [Sinanodonta woodiana]|uniref:Uncharacterized protein n=1 Tax=Sinanodonta woodiana TaxID=1069815 RepID=A0ABD3XQB2_SINWO
MGLWHLKRKAFGRKPYYNGVVLIDGMLVVVDYVECTLEIHNGHDGKLITSHKLKSNPTDVCLVSKNAVAVCLEYGRVVILSLISVDDVKLVTTLETGFHQCDSLAKWNSDKLVISGRKEDGMLCWGIVSFTDGRMDSNHDICKGYGTHMAVKDNNVYISCSTRESVTNGVYAYDSFKPNKQKFFYRHKKLQDPGSIVADRDYVYVCDSNRIHQLTDNGQLVTIHTVSSKLYGIFYDDQQGLLYTTSLKSNVIIVYKMESLHQPGVPIEILRMDDRSIQLFEEVLKDGKETVHNIRIMVVGHMGVGKTTLVKRLLGEEVNISERHSTEGIDVYVNCCDVSLSTHEWIRRSKDSGHDSKLQRLVKVLNENYQTGKRDVDSELDESSTERDTTDGITLIHVADDDKNTEVLDHHSQQQNMDQNLSSTSSLQKESSSTVVPGSLTPSEMNTIAGSEHGATENYKMDPLREMLKLLQQNPNKVKQDISNHAHLTILDFAGQYAFYTTHQMFLTRRAIYLLVTDASTEISDLVEDEFYFDSEGILKCKVHDLVQVWMNSIHSCAPPDKENLNSENSRPSFFKVIPPPVILVGTHIDQIPQKRLSIFSNFLHHISRIVSIGGNNPDPRKPLKHDEQVQQDYRRECGQRYLNEIRSYLSDKATAVHLVDEDFAIDNTILDSKLEELKKKIVEVASEQPYWGEQIPTRWFLLEQQLMRLRDAGVKVVRLCEVEKLSKEGTVRIKDSEELDLFLRYLHETGTIIYFSIEVLRDNVLLDPTWMIDALKILINARLNLPGNLADNDTESNSPADSAAHSCIRQKWSDFKDKGILTVELVDAIWTKENHPELHEHKEHILMIMEQLNILARPRSFNEMGEKVEDYFLAPCMLRQESPTIVIYPEEVPRMLKAPEMRCIFTGKYLPTPIFHRLLAACVARWPVAKKKDTSENLIFCGCCVFDLDLFHRLTVYMKNHVVYARITRMVVDDINTLDAKLCSRVRRFITLNLSKITSYLGQNLRYELQAEFQTWLADEGHDPDAPITREHINHNRLCVALVTVCGNALKEVLSTHVPAPHTDIHQAILANKSKLTSRQGRPLLNLDQTQLVFPDPQGKTTGKVDQFDLSLLYTLIRNISTVSAPGRGWGNYPKDQPRDNSLGASVERIRLYRNHIIGHSMDGKISQQDFDDYWKIIDAVLDDIELKLGRQGYREQLEKQRTQVISIYEAC